MSFSATLILLIILSFIKVSEMSSGGRSELEIGQEIILRELVIEGNQNEDAVLSFFVSPVQQLIFRLNH